LRLRLRKRVLIAVGYGPGRRLLMQRPRVRRSFAWSSERSKWWGRCGILTFKSKTKRTAKSWYKNPAIVVVQSWMFSIS
jgi:hypothetical protein